MTVLERHEELEVGEGVRDPDAQWHRDPSRQLRDVDGGPHEADSKRR